MAQEVDILIFVEDPGAANYVAQLPSALTNRGWLAKILADGHAKQHLLQLGVRPDFVQHPVTAHQIITSLRPRVLMIGTAQNPDTLGLALVAEAHSMGIESIGLVDALMNADYRFKGQSDKPLSHAPDWLLVADESTKTAYTALGFPAERVVVCGHPHYDYVRAVRIKLESEGQDTVRQRVLPKVPKGRKVVVFAAECSSRLYPLQSWQLGDYTLVGRGNGRGRTEVVLEEFLDAIKLIKPRPYVILRLHPKDVLEDYTEYTDEFDLISNGGSPFELLYAADLIVGLTSMLILEAALLGKRTLSIVPRAMEMDWLQTVRAGITQCVTSREQVRVVLFDLLCKSSHKSRTNIDIDDVISFGALQKVIDFTEKRLEWAKAS
jgi:hypothetical protein